MPYFLLVTVCMSVVLHDPVIVKGLGSQIVAYLLCLPLVAATAQVFPLVRVLETAAARALCSVQEGSLDTAPGAGRSAGGAERRRTACWFTLHVGTGAVVSGATLGVPPAIVVLLLYPFVGSLRDLEWPWAQGIAVWSAPLAGVALLVALVALAYGAGALLDRSAPVLLGPTPADRLALAEARAATLAARNRLARELHDSVGHALSAVTLQAAAARKVLGSDPEFASEALRAIEETTRSAVAELDTVLGVLREGDTAADKAPRPPTLAAGMDSLLDRTRAAGVTVVCTPGAGSALSDLPDHLSREAFRIVQEGLTNVLRHAGAVPVELAVTVESAGNAGTTENAAGKEHPAGGVPSADAPLEPLEHLEAPLKSPELTVRIENPLPETPSTAAFRGGGRGLRGIEERAALLGGSAESGVRDGIWRLCVRLPLHTQEAR
ncbi:histidine kinase [Streptomyces albidus (ex Kaewkla and Franco 2022)]|uniref:sensor histidine kinase n=1 Tax=Streptomyces albidus (ex Kaewkla and Franco 2022) TaxID=722709 RepID=UPI0015EE7D1D